MHREAENGAVIKIIGQVVWTKNGVLETSFSRQPFGAPGDLDWEGENWALFL